MSTEKTHYNTIIIAPFKSGRYKPVIMPKVVIPKTVYQAAQNCAQASRMDTKVLIRRIVLEYLMKRDYLVASDGQLIAPGAGGVDNSTDIGEAD
jgi:hypothetical protein